jgi:hypothetical protein
MIDLEKEFIVGQINNSSKKIPLSDGSVYCYGCKQYKNQTEFTAGILKLIEIGRCNTGICKNCRYNYNKDFHFSVLNKISTDNKIPLKCMECDEKEILSVAHINSQFGYAAEIRDFYGTNQQFYRAIISGDRKTNDLGILCPNHNILDEWKNGYRSESDTYRITVHAMEVICKNNNIELCCQKCYISDLRVLTIEHIDGGGSKERITNYKNSSKTFHRAIISGKRTTLDLSILCYTHQRKQKERN